ncbi:MAG: hypothetical protein II855_01390 [Candidatus Methanomethylophilaceae archaeon]|nr:hypothetical protein [Candidatus Methanomethylophilaceae archaeon]
MDTLVTIGICTAIAMAAVVLGSKVQKAARFIFPVDCMTISLMVLSGIDAVFHFVVPEGFWYLPFVLGYFVGYLVVGRTAYAMVWETSLANMHVTMYPWVIWEEHGELYLQEQTNRALLRRLLCGVKHSVVTNVPLSEDWMVETKYPLFPLFSKPTVIVEDIKVDWEPVHWFWKFNVKRYTTFVDIAYAGTVSKMQLAQDESYLKVLQNQNTSLIDRIHELESQQGPMLMEAALRIDQSVDETSPVNRMHALIREGGPYKDRKKKKTKEEEDAGKEIPDDETE